MAIVAAEDAGRGVELEFPSVVAVVRSGAMTTRGGDLRGLAMEKTLADVGALGVTEE